MNLIPEPLRPSPIINPESDGLPMADNTKQLRWIVVLYGNLAALFREVANVFVAGNLFWYPVEGQPELRQAGDVLVVFDRPKGHRSSYKQWEENNVPVTVAFEILSPSSDSMETADEHMFYEDHAVEEYYVYDPDRNRLIVYVRRGDLLRRLKDVVAFVSPRLGIRFDFSGTEMVVYYPNGQRFLTFEELAAEREREHQPRSDVEPGPDVPYVISPTQRS